MRKYNLNINGNGYEVVVKSQGLKSATVDVNGKEYHVTVDGIKTMRDPSLDKVSETTGMVKTATKAAPAASKPKLHAVAGADTLVAPIPGQIKGLFVKVGDKVTVGDKVLVMEAMKMENVITSDHDGVIGEIFVGDGDIVDQDQALVRIGE